MAESKKRPMKASPKRKGSVRVLSKRGKLEANLKTNEDRRLYAMASELAVRATIAARLGKSYGGKRDLYAALGYKITPVLEDYQAKYYRQDIARAIIDAPVRACWRQPPTITEFDKKGTDFEKAWVALAEKCRIFHYLSRADRLASIGSYSVLLMGFDDGGDFATEAKSAKGLLYLMPYGQGAAAIQKYDEDIKSERYGLPLMYKIQMSTIGTSGMSKSVHHSRVVHVAEDCLESDVEGIPRLKSVLNRLEDLDKVAGGSAEMFWRGALPGYGFKLDKDAVLGKQGRPDLEDEIEDYMHGLRRYMLLEGMSIENLEMQVADPSNHFGILIDLIACAIRMPKRILLGSERGELASSQDERAWADRIEERRREHCEAKILRPFVDRLVEVGILPKHSEEGYTVKWSDLRAPSDKEIAEIGETRSKSIKNYVDSTGADEIVPPEVFYEMILGLDQEEIERITMIQEGVSKELEEE